MNRSRYFLNPLALGYLLVVAAVLGWVGVDALFVDHADASLAGVWAFLVTAPASLLFVMLPGVWAWAGIAVGAVVNAAALGAAYRSVSGRGLRPTA
ncbi:SCO4225 family membrane protein [Streptomyces sp. NPDC048523]|uniref:SCO4225 family membrane protein n=1 Tax=Streptomyces sp. NPDC048523 TaxID=3365567 RepID=UPI0037173B75